MAIQLVECQCTRCGEAMRLPKHIVDLPCHARLCGVCTKRLLGQLLWVLEKMDTRG